MLNKKNCFPLDKKITFNLFKTPEAQKYLQAHKKSGLNYQLPTNQLHIFYKSTNNENSSGFRISFNTIPNNEYKIHIRATLRYGENKAFLYCESHKNQRLIPRVNYFLPTDKPTNYSMKFTATTDLTHLGILFHNAEFDGDLTLNAFSIAQINENPTTQSFPVKFTDHHPTLTRDHSTTAVMVEPRPDRLLIPIILHYLKTLPSNWNVQIFHGNRNHRILKTTKALQPYLKHQRLQLTNIHINNLTRQQYSQLLMTDTFYQQCNGKHILIFQLDTCINPRQVHRLNTYLNYHYIGAAWDTHYHKKSLLDPNRRLKVGNGGLSIRNRDTMIELSQIIHTKYPTWLKNKHEDHAICSLLEDPSLFPNATIASFDVAKDFTIESVYSSRAIGIHQAWNYFSPTIWKKILKENPEAQRLFSNKKAKK